MERGKIFILSELAYHEIVGGVKMGGVLVPWNNGLLVLLGLSFSRVLEGRHL